MLDKLDKLDKKGNHHYFFANTRINHLIRSSLNPSLKVAKARAPPAASGGDVTT
ncbi:MAG: hypothetical protein H7240_10550 [Glaciimonas sp.]|nr:hypothetical protein [Glaciimonas sp.]